MDKIILGNTGLTVSRLCFGGIPFGGTGWRRDPYVEPKDAGKVLKRAFELGINFWDTAEGYKSHPHIGQGLKLVNRKDIVLSTKTSKSDYDDAKKSVRNALHEMETEYLDILYMHYVSSPEDFENRKGALKAFLEAKEEGLAKHIGVSTHWSSVVEKVLDVPEIEVVLAKVNKIGRMDCPLKDMLKHLEKAHEKGKGVVAIKLLAYGDLTVEEGLEYTLRLPFIHSACLGIRTIQELEQDVAIYTAATGN